LTDETALETIKRIGPSHTWQEEKNIVRVRRRRSGDPLSWASIPSNRLAPFSASEFCCAKCGIRAHTWENLAYYYDEPAGAWYSWSNSVHDCAKILLVRHGIVMLVVVKGAQWQSPSHDWEYLGRIPECDLGVVPGEGRNDGWRFLQCRRCGTQIAAQILPFHSGWTYKWRDSQSRFHGIWLAPCCEEALIGPIMGS
jgi:hypothetical protein